MAGKQPGIHCRSFSRYARHMRCNWFTTARTSLRNLSQPCVKRDSEARLRPIFGQLQRSERSRSQHMLAFSKVEYTPSRPVGEEPAILAPSTPDSPLTQAQLSRAACHAVRMAFQNPIGGVEDAYLILNSLRYSSLNPTASEKPRQAVKDFESIAIKFSQPVSSRLASHALLHGLLRIGRKHDAARLSSQMMDTGVGLRSKTLKAVIRGLVPSSSPARRGPIKFPKTSGYIPNHSLSGLVPMAQNQSTRLALELLSLAGKTHQRRTGGMFSTLITICLINGEIILASLIFGFVVNEYQLRQTLAVHFKTGTPEYAISAAQDATEARSRYHQLAVEHLIPNRRILLSMLREIEGTMVKDGDTEESQHLLNPSLQALANLATLLDHLQIPFTDTGPLLRTLSKCPRTDEMVWVVDWWAQPKQVKAYLYFHEVIQRLTRSIPKKKRKLNVPPEGPTQLLYFRYRKKVLPPLDLHAYNTLLNYTLRHCQSPEGADRILYHMLCKRKPPLQPDIATYNILLRSATLLRQNSIAQEALKGLHVQFSRVHNPSGPSPPKARGRPTTTPVLTPVPTRSPKLSAALHAMHNGTIVPSELPRYLIQLDTHSLSTYVAYLTSIGQPHLIADLIFDVFPELQPIPHAVQISSSADELHLTRKRIRDICVARAVWYGPHVLCAMLNALSKAGKPGLAKCVWCLALQAERRSQGSTQPWFLPVHAYTTMIQCYVKEMKRPSLNPLYSKLSPHQAREQARRYGMAIYRRMKRRALELRRSQNALPITRVAKRNLQIPLPDARFFNVLLQLFAEHSRPRQAMRNMAHYRHNFRKAQARYAQSGAVSRYWHPKLREISKEMAKAGFAVPPSLRHVFVGRFSAGTLHRDPPQFLERRPLVYATYTRQSSPFSLVTMKDRGSYDRHKPRKRRRLIKRRWIRFRPIKRRKPIVM